MADPTSEADVAAAAAQGAASGAAQGAAATSAVQSTTEDVLKSLLTRTNQDIGADEFISAVLANAAGLNVLNGKQILDNTIANAQHSVAAAQGHLENVQTVQVHMLKDMVGHSKDVDQMHKDQAKLGSDRMWNLNETDQMATIVASVLGKIGPQGDAFVVALMSALGDAIKANK